MYWSLHSSLHPLLATTVSRADGVQHLLYNLFAYLRALFISLKIPIPAVSIVWACLGSTCRPLWRYCSPFYLFLVPCLAACWPPLSIFCMSGAHACPNEGPCPGPRSSSARNGTFHFTFWNTRSGISICPCEHLRAYVSSYHWRCLIVWGICWCQSDNP